MTKHKQWLEEIRRKDNIHFRGYIFKCLKYWIGNFACECLILHHKIHCLCWVGLVSLRKKTDNRKNLQTMALSHHCSFDILLKPNSSLKSQFLIALSWALSFPRLIIEVLWPAAQLTSKSRLKFPDNHQKSKFQIVPFYFFLMDVIWQKSNYK